MNQVQNAVSLHPYFKLHAGQSEPVKAVLRAFIDKAAKEPGMLYYGFSINGDLLCCREAYLDAQAVLMHLENVGPEIQQLLTLSDLVRLEIHGPAAELETLRAPLGPYNPEWYTWIAGVSRMGS